MINAVWAWLLSNWVPVVQWTIAIVGTAAFIYGAWRSWFRHVAEEASE